MGKSHTPAKQNNPPQSGEEGWERFEEDERTLRADAFLALGDIGLDESNVEEALRNYAEAKVLFEELGDLNGQAQVLNVVGSVHRFQSRYTESENSFHQALSLFQQMGNRRMEGVVLGNLGNLYQEQGDYTESIRHDNQALTIHREVGNSRDEGGNRSRYTGRQYGGRVEGDEENASCFSYPLMVLSLRSPSRVSRRDAPRGGE